MHIIYIYRNLIFTDITVCVFFNIICVCYEDFGISIIKSVLLSNTNVMIYFDTCVDWIIIYGT